MRKYPAEPWVLILLTTLCLSACSGSGVIPVIEPTLQENAAGVDAAELPAPWTPTASPTLPATTATAPGSIALVNLDGSGNLPILELATPVPASLSTETWQKVEGATASFMLPASFEVLDMGSEFGLLMAALMTGLMDGMVELANEIGQEFGAEPITPTAMAMSDLETAFSIDFVLAMENDQKTSAFLFSEPLEQPSSLEAQMQIILEQQDNPIEVLSQERVIAVGFETGRMSLLATDPETGDQGHILIYLILLSDRLYQIGYQTEADSFDELLPIFETSAGTFMLNP